METIITPIQLKLQDLSNRVDLLNQQLQNFTPELEEDQTLSQLVASLQDDITEFKTQITSFEKSLNSLNS